MRWGEAPDQICHINYELPNNKLTLRLREWMPYADNLGEKCVSLLRLFFAAVLMLWSLKPLLIAGSVILLRGIRILRQFWR